jgi:hypothetical protein
MAGHISRAAGLGQFVAGRKQHNARATPDVQPGDIRPGSRDQRPIIQLSARWQQDFPFLEIRAPGANMSCVSGRDIDQCFRAAKTDAFLYYYAIGPGRHRRASEDANALTRSDRAFESAARK